MSLSECNVTVDEHGRELTAHGTTAFPLACYHDDFRICDVDWHWHEEWEAVVITQGNCLVAAGNHKVRLQPEKAFSFTPVSCTAAGIRKTADAGSILWCSIPGW